MNRQLWRNFVATSVRNRLGHVISEESLQRLILVLEKEEIDSNPSLLSESFLAKHLTVGETYFLRHEEQFHWVCKQWLPACLQQKSQASQRTLQILSAGCATGEEAYTLAAMLSYEMKGQPELDVRVLGVDINESFIEKARTGNYSDWSLRKSSYFFPDWIKKQGDNFVVDEWVKEKVRFETHNLLDSLFRFETTFDLIFCRNVLIYFHPDGIKSVWRNLKGSLGIGGAVVIAPGDPSPASESGLEMHWFLQNRYFQRTNSPSKLSRFMQRKQSPEFLTRVVPFQKEKPALQVTPEIANTEEKRESPTLLAELAEHPPEEGRDWLFPGVLFPEETDFQRIGNLLREEEHPEALSLLSSLELDESYGTRGLLLCTVFYLEAQLPPKALNLAKKLVFLNSEEPFFLFVLGYTLKLLGEYELAEQRSRWGLSLLDSFSDEQVVEHTDGVSAITLREWLESNLS